MTGIGLNIGLRALLSSQFVLDTIGHNIANANVPGYSRQRVQLSAALPVRAHGLLIGGGVDALSVQRQVDELLARRTLAQVSVWGGLESRLGGQMEVEALFAEPSESALGGLIDRFFSAISDLSSSPEDAILRSGVVQSTQSMTSQFNQLASSLTGVRRDVEGRIGTLVGQVNLLAKTIADLNIQISATASTGVAPNDLHDQRDRAVKELSKLVEVTTLQDPGGETRVLIAGNTLVSGGRVSELSLARDPQDRLAARISGADALLPLRTGALGGLFELLNGFTPRIQGRLDSLARNMILEVNRVHSTGIPANGPLTVLTGQTALQDRDGDGRLRDELLSNAGLPFDVVSGTLHVSVTNAQGGILEKHRIEISSTHTTVQDFLDALNAIPELSADLDASGRVRIVADAGKGFDFSRRIDPSPDSNGTFGGGKASLGTPAPGPFSLANGDTLDLTIDPGGAAVSIQIPFATGDFDEISRARADEVAAVINADPDAQANGITAVAVEGTLFVQTAGEGDSTSFRVDGGAVATAVGWGGLVGTTVTGSENVVEVELTGIYEGAQNDVYTFRPNMDGVVGTTPGLVVEVFDSGGQRVATIDVGPSYQPGEAVSIGSGLSLSFGLGELSATHGDLFAADVVADSDTSDVLVALGLNSLLVGSGAGDVTLRADIADDPSLFASSLTGSAGDSTLLLELLDVEEADVKGLGGVSLGQFYGNMIGDLGFQVSSATSALQSNQALIRNLEQRRDQVSGVNVDEELVDLLKYEQAFAAASQYISVVNQLSDELLNLL